MEQKENAISNYLGEDHTWNHILVNLSICVLLILFIVIPYVRDDITLETENGSLSFADKTIWKE
mgnify:CR=1 FL=1